MMSEEGRERGRGGGRRRREIARAAIYQKHVTPMQEKSTMF